MLLSEWWHMVRRVAGSYGHRASDDDTPLVDDAALEEYRMRAPNRTRGAVYERKYGALLRKFTPDKYATVDTSRLLRHVGDDVVVFCPTLVDFSRAAAIQCDIFHRLQAFWSEHASIHFVLDLHNLTNAVIARALQSVHADTFQTGVDLWTTLPCKYRRITVCVPDHLFVWPVMFRTGSLLLSSKMRARLHELRYTDTTDLTDDEVVRRVG